MSELKPEIQMSIELVSNDPIPVFEPIFVQSSQTKSPIIEKQIENKIRINPI